MITDKTKTIATANSGDTLRLMRAMGIKDEFVTAFTLSASGPGEILTVSVTRYLTEAELAALADELEANPLKAEPASLDGSHTEALQLTEEIKKLGYEIKALRREMEMLSQGGAMLVETAN